MNLVPVKLSYVAMSLLLSVSLMGCANKPQKQPDALPKLPPPPSLSTPLPSVSYSLSAAESERASQQRLMGTRLMRDYSTSYSNPKEKP